MKKSSSCKRLIEARRKLIEIQVRKLLKETGASDVSVSCFRADGDIACSLNLSFFPDFPETPEFPDFPEPPVGIASAKRKRKRKKL